MRKGIFAQIYEEKSRKNQKVVKFRRDKFISKSKF